MMQFNHSASDFDRAARDLRDQANHNPGNRKSLIAEANRATALADEYRAVARRPRESWQDDVAAFFASR